ncbi:MAG: metal-dependent hydrolase [Dehalococcoidia bacterium]|jgi:hypothetical protein|nr:metal-dependent hydrolase [Dehalococcoidia bacterium]MDH4368135.1 metal-dependent hydrolase [Dehalococcoidia bacterium]
MWLAHIAAGLSIGSYTHCLEGFLLANAFHHLPSVDQLIVDTGLVKKEFHDAEMHTPFFALGVAAVTALFSWKYALLALICIGTHLLMDLPTDTGLMLLYPFSRRRFTLKLVKNTNGWGLRGFYRQKWAIILETPIWLFFLYRLIVTLVFGLYARFI